MGHTAEPTGGRDAEKRTQDGGREDSLDEGQRAVIGLLRDVHHQVPQAVLVEDGLQAFQDPHPLPLFVLIFRQNEQRAGLRRCIPKREAVTFTTENKTDREEP